MNKRDRENLDDETGQGYLLSGRVKRKRHHGRSVERKFKNKSPRGREKKNLWQVTRRK